MVRKQTNCLVLILLLLPVFLLFFEIQLSDARTNLSKTQNDKKKDQSSKITQLELQSELMSFADRFSSILGGAYQQFVQEDPKQGALFIAREGGIFTLSAAYTIAAEPNPTIALLDMTIMVSLGRMIYEDTHLKNFGEDIQLILKPLIILEQDIWRIASRLMTLDEQKKLRKGIIEWRRKNPDQRQFSYLRSEKFASDRNIFNLAKEIDPRGMFSSIKKATTEAERMRLVAERAMYLSTRIPLLFGVFGEVWLQKVIMNPEFQEIKSDFNRVSKSLEKLTIWTESFQTQLQNSSKNLLSGIKDKEVKNFFTQVHNTVMSANTLSESMNENFVMADALLLKLPGQLQDIKEFEKNLDQIDSTIQNLNVTLSTANQLLSSPNLANILDSIVPIINQYEKDAKNLITYFVVSTGGLILFLFICLFIYRYAEKKIIKR